MIASWMKDFLQLRRTAMFLCFFLLCLSSCSKRADEPQKDSPRLTPNVTMIDVTFHSAALKREMQYRVVLPAKLNANIKLPVVYLLHEGGGAFAIGRTIRMSRGSPSRA